MNCESCGSRHVPRLYDVNGMSICYGCKDIMNLAEESELQKEKEGAVVRIISTLNTSYVKSRGFTRKFIEIPKDQKSFLPVFGINGEKIKYLVSFIKLNK